MTRGTRIVTTALVCLLLAGFLVLPPNGAAAGSPYYVGTLADDDGTQTANCGNATNTDCTLRDAIAAASSGSDWIMFKSGLSGTITLTNGTLVLEKSLTITGPGADVITVSGGNAAGVFRIGLPQSPTRVYTPGYYPSFSITGLTIADGSAENGGGIDIERVESVNLWKMAFINNSAVGLGGALYVGVTVTDFPVVINDSTFSGNVVTGSMRETATGGGAIFSQAGRTVQIRNSTFYGNRTTGYHSGGGAILPWGPLSVVNSTITENYSRDGAGGISNTRTETQPVILTNTIVAGNHTDYPYYGDALADLSGYFQGDNNLIGITGGLGGGLPGSNNLGDVSPYLGTLGYYGGTTQTVPLLAGSPAIGGGTNGSTVPMTDQRGVERTDHVDIGAYQSKGGFSLTLTSGDHQTTAAGSNFPQPFVVTVGSAFGEPVVGGGVTFTGPTTGAGIQGSPVQGIIGADGSTHLTLKANAPVGTYTVYASINGAPPITFSLTNTDSVAPITSAIPTKIDLSGYTFGTVSNLPVTITLVATDLQAVVRTEYTIDGGPTQTYQDPFLISAAGTHTVEYWSTDEVGNVEPRKSAIVKIDSTVGPPDTVLVEHPPAVTTSDPPTFTFSGVAHGNSVARYECKITAPSFDVRDALANPFLFYFVTFASCSTPFEVGPATNNSYTFTDGAYTFAVRAIDAAGQVDPTPATFTWTVDTVAPDTTLLTTPPAQSGSSSATFTFSGSDNLEVVGFECALDAAAFSACASPLSLSGLSNGSHTLQVRAVDQAGTVDATPASYAWTVEAGPPDTTILTQPAGISNVASATFTFSGAGGVASFECKLDGGSFAACTSPKALAALSDGSHTFQVRAIGASGQTDPTPAAYTWTVDTTAPETTMLTQPPAITGSAAANFTFSGSDASGVAGFECKLDSGAFATCASPAQYGSLAGGQHTFQVRAIDGSGNVDPSPASFTWTVDSTAPDTTILTMPFATSANPAPTFTFSGSDSNGIGGYECKLDGASFASCGSPLGLSGLSEGSHTFQVRAIDTAGNVDPTPAGYTWLVDSLSPDTAFLTTPAAVSNSTAASFTFSGSDANGIGSFECRLDSAAFAACASPLDLSGLGDGSHTVQVRAIDAAGHVDPSPASYTWAVDRTPPDTTILTQPDALSASASTSFTVSGSDANGVASFECKLDNGGFAACGSITGILGLADGAHTFQVRAIDTAGNVDPTPAGSTWTVDTTAPETTLLTTPPALSGSTSASVGFSGSDPSGVARLECALDGSAFATCTSPRDLVGLADGAHTFQVRAIDNAGNVDATPATVTWTIDTVPPDTTLLTTPPSLSNSAAPVFTFSGSDASGIAGYECRLDSGSFSACASPANLTGLNEGAHTLQVRAIDQAGKVDPTPASYTWTIDLTASDTTLQSTPLALSNTPAPAFTFSGSDPSGITGYQCTLDAGDYTTCASPLTLSGLAEGVHTLQVRALDGAGNLDPTPAAYTWTVDTTPPVSQPAPSAAQTGGWYTDRAVVSLSATDLNGVAAIHYQIDGGAWQTYSAPFSVTGNGAHTVAYYAVDNAGNVEATRSLTLNVDAAAPLVTISSPLGTTPYVLNSAATAAFGCSDPGGSGIASCTGTVANGALIATGSTGKQVFTVTATDNVGKVTTQSVSYTVGYPFTLQMTGVSLAPRMNQARAGDPVYLKFSLGGNLGLTVLAAGSPTMQAISCSTGTPLGTPVALPVLAGLRYMPAGYYQIVWKTQPTWVGKCYQVTLSFTDGSSYRLNYRFTSR